ncbi:MAG: anti-sigma factor [Bacteroidetes bacterium]|nr:MAG: anti-sigma factor [Bacteroidota bacterium]
MNIKEYISSGVVESYVLGLLTAQERFEFEQYCEAYPELKAARDAFELAVEKQAMENAVSPPANVKEKVFSAIQQRPVSNTSKIVSMEPTIRRSAGLRWMAAASIILFLVTGYFAYKLYNQNKDLNNSLKSLQVKVDQMEEYHKIMSDPNVAVVNMVAMTPAKASASIYWDSTSSDVYLLIKNMPQLPSDKQYQLWSIMNGENGQLQPNSLGLFDVGENQKIILKMSNVKKADAFAITIEKRGNTEGPNLEQLQSMGKTKIQ